MSHHTGLVESVRRRGYRMTPQREMILDAIHNEGHISADDIFQRVRARARLSILPPCIATLELLKGLGIVTAIDTGEGCVHYELAGELPHHHLVLRGCGHILELDRDVLLPIGR